MDKETKIFQSEKTLHVLKEIERNPHLTQRDLAQKLKISLGKINYLLNALIDKGIIEIKNFKNSKHKLAYRYMLTSHGIKIKLELTRQFFIWKTQEYERLREEIESLKQEVSVAASEKEKVLL